MCKYPGGFDSLAIRELLDSLVMAHTCKAITSEKMSKESRLQDLAFVKQALVESAHFIRSVIEEKEGVLPLGGNAADSYKRGGDHA